MTLVTSTDVKLFEKNTQNNGFYYTDLNRFCDQINLQINFMFTFLQYARSGKYPSINKKMAFKVEKCLVMVSVCGTKKTEGLFSYLQFSVVIIGT